MTIAALMSEIMPAPDAGASAHWSLHRAYGSCLDDLDLGVEVGRVLVGDASDALHELAVDAGTQLDGGAVRANRDDVSGRDAAPAGVTTRESDLLLGALELQLGDPFHLVPGEERRVPE